MRIARRDDADAELLRTLASCAGAGLRVEGRVCGSHCTDACPHCGSRQCQCLCTPYCAQATRALSSEPDRHPIEPAITPLVFELQRTGAFEPCYSCEGHARSDGSLYRPPSVWFYCANQLHLRLLASALDQMRLSGGLSAPWRIRVTFSDADNAAATFALEPDLPANASADLTALQADAGRIAFSLQDALKRQAAGLGQTLRPGD